MAKLKGIIKKVIYKVDILQHQDVYIIKNKSSVRAGRIVLINIYIYEI